MREMDGTEWTDVLLGECKCEVKGKRWKAYLRTTGRVSEARCE